jgi:hypothetical protein
MNDLLKFQQDQIYALQKRNAYLENELKQAKDLFQDLINDWEVKEFEVVNQPNIIDEMFNNPLQQLNELF